MENNKRLKSEYHLEILRKYFNDFEIVVSTSRSRMESEKYAEERIEKFSMECESEIIKNSIKKYVDDIINKYH